MYSKHFSIFEIAKNTYSHALYKIALAVYLRDYLSKGDPQIISGFIVVKEFDTDLFLILGKRRFG